MFALIATIGKENIVPGDPVVLKYDAPFGRIGAFDIGGETYGYICERQPQGCVDETTLYARIGDYRILARAAVVFEGGLLVSFDTPAFAPVVRYEHTERAGYGMLAVVR